MEIHELPKKELKIQSTLEQHMFELQGSNNICLNCKDLLIYGFFFSIVNTRVLHNSWLVEPGATKRWIWRNSGYRVTVIWRADYKLYVGFQLM